MARGIPPIAPLHAHVKRAVAQSILPVTPIQTVLDQCDMREGLASASEELLERYHRSGVVWLDVCFNHAMFLDPPGERPVGHFSIIHDSVLSPETVGAMMSRADMPVNGHNTTQVEAMAIFIAAVIEHEGPEFGLEWFMGLFMPVIRAADDAYMAFDGSTSTASQGSPTPIKRYRQVAVKVDASEALRRALGLLLPSASANSTAKSKTRRSSGKSKNVETIGESELRTGEAEATTPAESITGTVSSPLPEQEMRAVKVEAAIGLELAEIHTAGSSRILKTLDVVSRFVRRESCALVATAFPDGVLALAEAPRAFATGFMSAFMLKGPQRTAGDDEAEQGPGTPHRHRRRIAPRASAPSPPTARERRSFVASPTKDYYRSGPIPPHRRRLNSVTSVTLAVDVIEANVLAAPLPPTALLQPHARFSL
ncbi:hypothetical protein C8R46DRAFT_1307867 [Mycena filopes]|nr:hypothetical protein C8R46DRAFT_1307867 [Mycena filopes]